MSLEFTMTKKDRMFTHFLTAQEAEIKYYAIKIRMSGFPGDETIINPLENIDDKREYWDTLYDGNLVHKHSPIISIVGWDAADSYEEIEKYLG